MISELSENGQYICTTFRPELIPHADAYFGVIFNATKISNVKKREFSRTLSALGRLGWVSSRRSKLTFSPFRHSFTVSADECQEFIEGESCFAILHHSS